MEAHLDVPAARTLSAALDLHSRICMGQVEIVEEAMRSGLWAADGRLADAAERVMHEMKGVLNQPRNGSWGIGSPNVHVDGKRAWELKKVVDRALHDERGDPEQRHTVWADGLTVRYTKDPAPTASVSPGSISVEATEEQWAVAREALDTYRSALVGDVSFIGRMCEAGIVGRRQEVGRGNSVSRKLEAAEMAALAESASALSGIVAGANLPDDADGTIAIARDAVDAALGSGPTP